MDEREVAERVGRVEALLAVADERAVELAGALLALYGEALSRVMATVMTTVSVEDLAERVAADELVSHLLVLHGLHPVEVRVRVGRAVERVAGSVAELVEVGSGLARVRVRRAAGGCGSARAALRAALEVAVREAAPEVERVEIEVVDGASPVVVIGVEELLAASVRRPSRMRV